MSFEPFIEGEENVVIRPVSGGINLSVISNVLQGIDKRNKYRFKGILPILGTGEEDNEIKDLYFGHGKDYDDSVPFSDKFEPTSLEYKNSPDSFSNFSFSEGLSIEGVIEPLTIRDLATLDGIEGRFVARTIKGEFENINLDIYGASDQIKQFKEIKLPTVVEPYEDSSDYLGTLISGSIKIPGYVSDLRRKCSFFNESSVDSRNRTNNSSINTTLNAMTSSYDDSLVPNSYFSTCAGYTYFSSSFGTDSVAFGNLRRS